MRMGFNTHFAKRASFVVQLFKCQVKFFWLIKSCTFINRKVVQFPLARISLAFLAGILRLVCHPVRVSLRINQVMRFLRNDNLTAQFYRFFPIVSALRTQLSWTQYKLLLAIDNQTKENFILLKV